MQKDSSTFGLSREKLSKLWKLGEDKSYNKDDLDEEQKKAELLKEQLAKSLPLDAGMQHLLPKVFTVVCEKFSPFTGCSYKDLLLDQKSEPLILETIKDFHKEQAESAPSELEQEIASIVYYTAIASALVYHDVKITKLSYKNLSQSFNELRVSNWLFSDLKNLFSRAYDQCIKLINE